MAIDDALGLAGWNAGDEAPSSQESFEGFRACIPTGQFKCVIYRRQSVLLTLCIEVSVSSPTAQPANRDSDVPSTSASASGPAISLSSVDPSS